MPGQFPPHPPRRRRAFLAAASGTPVLRPGRTDHALPPRPRPVSREEYERLRKEVESLRRELGGRCAKAREAHAEETDATLRRDRRDARRAPQGRQGPRRGAPARSSLSGNATSATSTARTTTSTFSVVVRPLFLWRLSDRLLFEAKPEIRLQQGTEEVSVTLEYADLSYVVHDAVIVGAGKFLTPFGLFPDRFYPGKLLEEPLVYQRGQHRPRAPLRGRRVRPRRVSRRTATRRTTPCG